MRSIYLENATPGSAGFATESGWMDKNEFVKFMSHFIKHSNAVKTIPTLLLLDNHTSHLSTEAIDMAIDNGITMLSFPPHCSHRMQPLDVSVFGPLKTYYNSQCNAWTKNNAGKLFEIHHVPLVLNKCLDLALTPKNIKSGFSATGIYPFNPDIFTEVDYMAAEVSAPNTCVEENDSEENQRRIVVTLDTASNVGKKVSATDSANVTWPQSLEESLNEVGPVHYAAPRKKLNRGPKAMGSSILTSPEIREELKMKQTKREEAKRKKENRQQAKIQGIDKRQVKRKQLAKKQPKRRRNRQSSSSSEDSDFCIICLSAMPKNLNANNSINCNTCARSVHLKCAQMTRSYFTCKHCDSEYSDNEE